MSDPLYYVNGDLVPASEASISVRDRGFLYGDAVFETLRIYNGVIFEWEAHVARLVNSCSILDIDHDFTTTTLRSRIEDTLEANGLKDAYVRISITRGVQPGKLTPLPDSDPGLVIILDELPPGGPGSVSVWDGPATVTIATTRRTPNLSIPARAKTHNYLNGILARLEARLVEADEAVMCNRSETITEGATSNCFFVNDGAVHTPALDGPVLPGITRSVVLALASELEIPCREGSYGVDDLLSADEGFLTNTTWEVRPIASVDGTEIGEGPITRSLREAFDEYVADSCP